MTRKIFLTIFAFLFGWSLMWLIKTDIQIALVKTFGEKPASSQSAVITSNPWLINKASSFFENKIQSYTKKADEVTVLIGGDVMLDRSIRQKADKYGYEKLFEPLIPLFKNADIVALNLEGPITTNKSKTALDDGSTSDLLTFTFDPQAATALANAGVTVVSLANNHTDNFGIQGLEETKRWLDDAGVMWFGSPQNNMVSRTIDVKDGGKISFVGYHAFQKGFSDIVAEVKKLNKNGNFIIVMPHWGEEYVSKPSAKMRQQAKELVDAGAKAVIGTHPHVIGENEWINTVPIYYSLGNLIFDQYFSPETKKGQLIELHLTIKDKKIRFDNFKIIETENSYQDGVSILEN